MKSALRFSKASGSTKRRVEKIIRQGDRAFMRQFNSARWRALREGGVVLSKISLGTATSAAITGNTTADQVITNIRTGKWAPLINALRTAAVDEADHLKRKLPAVLWSGIFSERKIAGLIQHSGLLCADIDDVPDHISNLREIARTDPHVVAAFTSPSGTGFKIVFRVSDDSRRHAASFNAVRSYVAERYSVAVDEAAKDVARLCFVSHDPDAIYNSEAQVLDIQSPPDCESDEQQARADTGSPGAKQGDRNNAAFKLACKCRDEGKSEDETEMVVIDFASRCNPPLPETEATACVRSAFKHPPKSRARPLPPIVDATTFVADKSIVEPPQLVSGVLHQGSKVVFGGGSKSHKTWALLDLGISIASGVEWLGFTTARGKVLYVNFEISPHAWQKRIKAVSNAKGVELQPGQIHLWNLRGHGADFHTLIPKIIENTRTEQFALIILDPIYKLYGGTDENAAGDVAALLNAIERLAVETGAAVAFGAHFAKGNAGAKEAIDRISGSGVFARDPDSLLIFTRHEQDCAFTVDPILRNFAPVEPFAVRWSHPLMQRDNDLDPRRLKKSGGRPPKHTGFDLLALLPPEGLTNAEWLAAAEESGIGKSSYYELRKSLKKTGKIHEAGQPPRWMPNRAGGKS